MSNVSTCLKYIDIKEASDVYKRGENVTLFLKEKYRDTASLSDIIEVAYDLQAGTYIDYVLKNMSQAKAYWLEIADIVTSNVSDVGSLLDVGAGELTTLCGMIDSLGKKPEEVFAFDVSWSRLARGLDYVEQYYSSQRRSLNVFCADIASIPLPTSSIDLIVSSHALEPNRAQQDVLLDELLRVAKSRLMLFEPCYEISSKEGKQQMDLHGYIKDFDNSIQRAGATLVDKIAIQNIANPLNPTVCYIIDVVKKNLTETVEYTLPGTDYFLRKANDWLISDEAGVSFPILNDLPCLRMKNAVVSTALCSA